MSFHERLEDLLFAGRIGLEEGFRIDFRLSAKSLGFGIVSDLLKSQIRIADRFLEPVTQGLSGGEFLVDVPTALEGMVSIQVSTNLRDWTHVCTVPAVDGHARFVDPEARSLTRRFYQAVPAVLNLEALDD